MYFFLGTYFVLITSYCYGNSTVELLTTRVFSVFSFSLAKPLHHLRGFYIPRVPLELCPGTPFFLLSYHSPWKDVIIRDSSFTLSFTVISDDFALDRSPYCLGISFLFLQLKKTIQGSDYFIVSFPLIPFPCFLSLFILLPDSLTDSLCWAYISVFGIKYLFLSLIQNKPGVFRRGILTWHLELLLMSVALLSSAASQVLYRTCTVAVNPQTALFFSPLYAVISVLE